jgi:hypothetical protein
MRKTRNEITFARRYTKGCCKGSQFLLGIVGKDTEKQRILDQIVSLFGGTGFVFSYQDYFTISNIH